jgi:hypothetical protein
MLIQRLGYSVYFDKQAVSYNGLCIKSEEIKKRPLHCQLIALYINLNYSNNYFADTCVTAK